MLRDVIGEAGLSFYPQVALVLFILVFLSICVYVFFKKKSKWDKARYMPLEESDNIGMNGEPTDTEKAGEGKADGGE